MQSSNKDLKILYLANLPAPYTVEYFKELGKRCDLTVVYERKSASDRDSKWRTDSGNTYKEYFLKGKNIGTENSFCPTVTKYLKASYDAIIIGTYSSYTAMWAIGYLRFHKIPYVISSDGGFIAYGENPLKKRLKTTLIGGAAAWLSSGIKTNEYLKYYGAKEEKIFIYPFTSISEEDILEKEVSKEEKIRLRRELGLLWKGQESGDSNSKKNMAESFSNVMPKNSKDISEVFAEEACADKNMPSDDEDIKIVVGVGQFIHRKGWDVLVRAAAILNEKKSQEDTAEEIYSNASDKKSKQRKADLKEKQRIQYYIIGGSEEAFKSQFVNDGISPEEIPSNIHTVPFCNRQEVFKYYKAADLFVLPTREDIWGLVVNEAMANALPVITTDRCIAGLELVKDGINGYVVKTEDAQAMAEAIGEIMEKDSKDSEDRCSMGEASLEAIRGYTYSVMAKRTMEMAAKLRST